MWHPQATISLSIFARKVLVEGMLHTRGSTPSVPVHKITLLGTSKQKDLGKKAHKYRSSTTERHPKVTLQSTMQSL
jgi:hypothetical protein